jgi:hypothetical protein
LLCILLSCGHRSTNPLWELLYILLSSGHRSTKSLWELLYSGHCSTKPLLELLYIYYCHLDTVPQNLCIDLWQNWRWIQVIRNSMQFLFKV